jgi:short-subunit dehydrogenase
MQAVVPHMRRAGGGRIVNIASIAGLVAVPHLVPYSASKHALIGLSDGMRAELAKDNIRVTTVAPGLLRTGSPPNTFMKGQHKKEYAWFTIADANPLLSMSAERAAAQIVEACRYGDPALTISTQARILQVVNHTMPSIMANLMAAFAHFLPGPTDQSGDRSQTGWESQSPLAPSVLTALSDKATVENNELRVETPINGERANEVGG